MTVLSTNIDAVDSPDRSIFSGRRMSTRDVLVLAGGPGSEREVSLQSGKAVAEALTRLAFRPSLRDISPNDLSALDESTDFAFIALHGEFGEDGTVQAELERRGIPYCGTGPQSSQLAMNKVDAKRCFIDHQLPTPEFLVVRKPHSEDALRQFGVPAVVKPVTAGSSVDTFIAKTTKALVEYTALVAERYGEALLERYIKGRELTVGILGEEALPVCEIRTHREFYDYQAKYVDEDTQYLFDLDLSPALLRGVQETALAAHRALGCEVFSRVDIMLDEETRDPFLLEVNTIPGFTSHSLVPKAAARNGISFDELCRRIIELSLSVRG